MGTAVAAAPVVSAYPDPITLPAAPHGDPIGVRLLARLYRQRADQLEHTAHQLAAISTDLAERWQGTGATALHTPTQLIDGNLHQLATSHRHTADTLERYADALHHAQHHHGWSLGKIAALGAIVTVTAVAVVVTVGAAAPVGTAAAVTVGEAIAGAEAAAATATAAETTAIAALGQTGLTAALQTLRLVALRQLTAGAANTTLDLGLHAATGRKVTPGELALDLVTGTTAAATVDATRTALRATETWQALSTNSRAALDTTALTTTLTTDDALHQYETSGHLNPTQLTETAILGAVLGGRPTSEAPAPPAIASITGAVPRGQTIAELMRDGVRLDQHEGPYPLGHVLAKHVGLTVAQLKARLRVDARATSASSFPDGATAEAAITDALRLRPDKLAYVASRPGNAVDFAIDVGWVIGTVARRDGTVVTSQVLVLKIVNVGGRVVVRTAFVGNP